MKFAMRRLSGGHSLAVAALLLLAGSLLVWLQLQRQLDRRLDRLLHEQASAGVRLDAGARTRGGWPFGATLTLEAPRLVAGHGGAALTWTADRITASISLLHPHLLTVLARGTQTVSLGEEAAAGAPTPMRRRLRFWGGRIALVIASRPGRLVLEADNLHLALPGAGPDDVLTVGHLDGLVRWNAEARAVDLELAGIGLPRSGSRHHGSGPAISHGVLAFSVIGPLDSPRPGDGGGSVQDRLAAWRDGDGKIVIRRAALAWDDSAIDASGVVSLDGTFEPDGRFIVGIRGIGALLDRLARTGRITPSAASAVGAVTGLIGAARDNPDADPQNPDRSRLELPLTLHAGLLSLGQIPLLQVPSPRDLGVIP